MRIAAFTKYDRLAASTRQRILQYEPALSAAGHELTYSALLPDAYVQALATGKKYPPWKVVPQYLARFLTLHATAADVLWIYAELFPYLPAWFEGFAGRLGRPIIYDFDDAFFARYDEAANPISRAVLKGKLEPLLRTASACCCGTEYLRAYAAHYCENSIGVPTVVDTDVYRPREDSATPAVPTIGWIGSPSTWQYVRPLLPLLRGLVERGEARVKIVGAGAPGDGDAVQGLEWMEWSEATEVENVQSMDIGIMPLPDDQWTRGKSGYKLVQYMACGLPVVASPVGVNISIVADAATGFLASSEMQWRSALNLLISNAELRRKMGEAGRARAKRDFSLHVYAPRIVELFESVVSASMREDSAAAGT